MSVYENVRIVIQSKWFFVIVSDAAIMVYISLINPELTCILENWLILCELCIFTYLHFTVQIK